MHEYYVASQYLQQVLRLIKPEVWHDAVELGRVHLSAQQKTPGECTALPCTHRLFSLRSHLALLQAVEVILVNDAVALCVIVVRDSVHHVAKDGHELCADRHRQE